jgi:hypothetical protein
MRARYRYIKVKLTDDEWFALKELKARLHCATWDELFKKILRNKDEIIRLFSVLPP